MSDMREQNQTFELLDRTLEVFGADSARWPVGVKTKLAPLLDSNADARRRVAEAAALDNVLSFAPTITSARRNELADQIVAKAVRQPRTVSAGEGLPARRSPASRAPGLKSWRENSLVAGALAASLMLGILSGQNTTVGTLSEAMLTSVDAAGSSAQQVAQSDELDSYYDEDLL